MPGSQRLPIGALALAVLVTACGGAVPAPARNGIPYDELTAGLAPPPGAVRALASGR